MFLVGGMEGWTTVSEVTIRNTRSSGHQQGWRVASPWEPSTWIRKGHADPGMWISSSQAKGPSSLLQTAWVWVWEAVL